MYWRHEITLKKKKKTHATFGSLTVTEVDRTNSWDPLKYWIDSGWWVRWEIK